MRPHYRLVLNDEVTLTIYCRPRITKVFCKKNCLVLRTRDNNVSIDPRRDSANTYSAILVFVVIELLIFQYFGADLMHHNISHVTKSHAMDNRS